MEQKTRAMLLAQAEVVVGYEREWKRNLDAVRARGGDPLQSRAVLERFAHHAAAYQMFGAAVGQALVEAMKPTNERHGSGWFQGRVHHTCDTLLAEVLLQDPPEVKPGAGVADPALAVDRALSPRERGLFTEKALVGEWQGAEPVDYIATGRDCDADLGVTNQWWIDRDGATLAKELAGWAGLPEQMAGDVLACAVYVTSIMGVVHEIHATGRPYPYELARRAAMWLRGYGDALGGWAAEQE